VQVRVDRVGNSLVSLLQLAAVTATLIVSQQRAKRALVVERLAVQNAPWGLLQMAVLAMSLLR
jgi:hypothetical protein